MCKLCGKATEYCIKYKPKTKAIKEFISVTYEYLGEYPCKSCIIKFYSNLYKRKCDIDKYIFKKYFICNVMKAMSNYVKDLSNYKSALYSKNIYKHTIIITGIKITTNIRTEFTSYTVNLGKHDHKKAYTLEEAVFMRIKYLAIFIQNKNKPKTNRALAKKRIKELEQFLIKQQGEQHESNN